MNDDDYARYLAHFDQHASHMTDQIWLAARGVRNAFAAGKTAHEMTLRLASSYAGTMNTIELALCAARGIVQLAELTEEVVPNPPTTGA